MGILSFKGTNLNIKLFPCISGKGKHPVRNAKWTNSVSEVLVAEGILLDAH